jgi:asparagine synthase (glutamine-hydrolysing)
MCGICGILDYSGCPIDPALVDRMRDSMANRGPDDAGTHVLPFIGLGHRRLSIIDLSARGRQPMTNETGSICLVFNGEIYDFEPLRLQLVDAGHRFRGESDSEVIVHGYEEWGIDTLVQKLNGMFAFALWDAHRRELHLTRDRLGKKPLYYGWERDRFVFASELKALWTLSPGKWKVRPESIARYLYWGYLPGRETIYRDLYQLLPARVLTIGPNLQRERRYWSISFAAKTRAPLAEVIEHTDNVVTAAIRRRLRSDVKLGAFLSGGVDSSYIVSRMAALADSPIRTFSMGTPDRAHDEREFARSVATHCGTEHTEFEVTPDAWSLLPRLVWEFGQPFADPACVPTYYVAEQARRHVTVALTGDGGDEAFAGYSHHQGRHLGALVGRAVSSHIVDRILGRSTTLMDGGGSTRYESAARFVRYTHPDPLVYWGHASRWILHHLPRLWSAEFRDLAHREVLLGYALEVDSEFDGRSSLDRSLHHDLNVLLPFCFNVKLDVATMMSSLEARCPFQDREVVEWTAKLPASVLMRGWERKSLLKRVAAQRLPRHVIYRRKHGFSLPVDAWFRGSWAGAAHDVIFSEQARARGYFDYRYLEELWAAHANGTARHGFRFWAVLWLELWHRTFVDCLTVPATSTPLAQCGREL